MRTCVHPYAWHPRKGPKVTSGMSATPYHPGSWNPRRPRALPRPLRKAPKATEPTVLDASLTRRGFLRGAALAGTGLVAATVAACAPAAAPSWSYATSKPAPLPSTPPATPVPTGMPGMSAAPSATPAPSAPVGDIPAGWSEHDVEARDVVRRYVGQPRARPPGHLRRRGLRSARRDPRRRRRLPRAVPAARLRPGPPARHQRRRLTPHAEARRRRQGLRADHRRDRAPGSTRRWRPSAALGYNGQWPGPTIRVTEGDKVRAIFKNNLKETTGVHFHGVDFDDFFMDGVPFITQLPIVPGESFTYEFVAKPARLDDVPLPPQRDRPGGPRPPGRLHRRPERADGEVRPRVHLDLERHARRLHDQRPRLPGRRAGPRRSRRDGPRPVHERGDHDAPVAQPRVRSTGGRPRRAPARARRVRLRHPRRQPRRALRRDHHGGATRASGRSTATSCPTSRAWTACSAWSPR